MNLFGRIQDIKNYFRIYLWIFISIVIIAAVLLIHPRQKTTTGTLFCDKCNFFMSQLAKMISRRNRKIKKEILSNIMFNKSLVYTYIGYNLNPSNELYCYDIISLKHVNEQNRDR